MASSDPTSPIVYLTDVINGQRFQATGVLIAPDEVLTAAHVVYSSVYGLASNIQVYPGYNAGSAPFGGAQGDFVHYEQIQDANDTITWQDSQYDFAVVHLATPIAAAGTLDLLAGFNGGTVEVSGYPAALGGQLQTATETVSLRPGYTEFEGISLGAGASGGPVWVQGANGPQVVGIVSTQQAGTGSTANFTQITPAVLSQINAWVQQDNGTALMAAAGAPVLWVAGATVQQWSLSGGVAVATTDLGGFTSGWSVVGAGDAWGDGAADPVFQDTDGTVAAWRVQHGAVTGSSVIGVASGGWTAVATGDFFGQGHGDLLFRNGGTAFATWSVHSGTLAAVQLAGVAGGDWIFAGTASLGSGADRVLFTDGSGDIADWTLSNGQVTAASVLGRTDWTYIGSGDFTGQPDLLFRATDGSIGLWTTANGQVTGAVGLGVTTADWQIIGITDVNGDGTPDILFRNTAGNVAAWLITNGHVSQSISVGSTDPGWQAVPTLQGKILPA
jgi:V8-like Glu-specific endopeptidase